MITVQGYKVKEKIYESANTQVYRAIREADNLPFILKVLRQTYPPPEKIAWFKREYEVTRKLELDGVIKTYGLETHQNQWVMIIEDFGGDSLSLLELAGKFELADFLRIAVRISEILGQIHQQNIMHKDINPSNIIYNPKTGQLKIIDFGISTVLSRENPTFRNPNVLEGTLAYMSPEQTGRMNRAMDYRTDFYSLGVTFYELITGRLPFSAKDPLELVHAHIAKQAVSLHEVRPEISQAISEIVMKLMSKDAVDRYRSAYGLKIDLEECLNQWRTKVMIEPFPLGRQDISERFQISQKLYGRENEVKTLMSAFERVSQGASEIMMVTGYAGIGKTALVQEIYKPITRQRGYFISGKFDQLQRNIPYASLIQAFRSLIRQILTESEDQIEIWRWKLQKAMGQNGQVITDVIPDLELIMGKQPAVPELLPVETQNRFNLLFQKFILVFADVKHPLVIFLDDLQWADAASLNFLNLLITASDSHYLFLIGAYRENEVSAAHPLILTLDEIKKAGSIVNSIALLPLELSYVNYFIADSVNCMPEKVLPLAELVLEKTQGNPFFIIEFLKSLYEEKLLVFDRGQGKWQCDLMQIKTHMVTDNVVELMVHKAQRLEKRAQEVLKLVACIGSRFDLNTLAMVYDKSSQETAADLWVTIKEGMIMPLADTYKLAELGVEGIVVDYRFAHDRVQQAVYQLISEEERQRIHLKIGRLFLKNMLQKQQSERIFDVVDQLNLGAMLITQQPERDELAKLNLIAGTKAKTSAAYGPALNYLSFGLGLLEQNSWGRLYDLTLELYIETAEAAYLKGNFAQMEEYVEMVLKKGRTLLDKVKVYQIQIQSFIARHKSLEAVQIAIPVLKLLGVKLPGRVNKLNILFGLLQTKWILVGKRAKDLANLPEMKDPFKLAAMNILSSIASAAYFSMPEMMPLVVFKQINLSVKYGNCSLSAFAYCAYGLILCGVLGQIDEGYGFGRLAINMLERFNAKELKAKILLVFNSFLQIWKDHVNKTSGALLEAYQNGLETGDIEFAALSVLMCSFHSYFIGKELSGLEREIASYAEAANRLKQEHVFQLIKMWQQMCLNLLGQSDNPVRLTGKNYDEATILPIQLEANDKTAVTTTYFNKAALCYLFQEYPRAVEYFALSEKYLDGVIGSLIIPPFYFYDSLAQLALFSSAVKSKKASILDKVASNQKKMKKWAKHAPMNYMHKFYLVEAERCRVWGHDGEAMRYYGKAVSLARENKYLNEEALANELAARFYFGKGVETAGKAYLQEAHYAYLCWGAKAKVKALENEFPWLLTKVEKVLREETTTTTPSTGTRGELLDLSAVMKASQAISSEIHLDKLLVKLMKIVIENAGAQLGYLILEEQGKLLIEAEGAVDEEGVAVMQSKPVNEEVLPMSIINYVARSKESVVLNNAAEEGDFTQDPYIKAKQSRSILCAPLLYQNELRGIIYLENNLTTGAFTSERLQMLQMLSAQAAVSIENANAYKVLEIKVEERTKELQNKMKDLKEFHDLAVGRELKMMEMEKKIGELEAKLGM